jgi:hypothetical protein
MKDCLGNDVTNFVPNNEPRDSKEKERYWHSTLVNKDKQAIRVYNTSGDTIGWNIIPREN